MSTIETVLLSLLVFDAIALTVLVLLQQGKGADVGAAFGSGASNTMFGSAGGTSFLTKATAWLAIGFFAIAFGLAYIAKQRAETAGSLGIPTVSGETTADVLTQPQESVDSPQVEGDVPAIVDPQDAAPGEEAQDDIPEI